MSDILTAYYSKLIKNGRCTIEQLPEDYREAVTNYMSTEHPVATPMEVPLEQTSINGALTIPKIDNFPLSIDNINNEVEVQFRSDAIFTPEVLGNNQFPVDIKYSIGYVENTYGRFINDPTVELTPCVGGFTLKISGKTNNIVTGDPLLRVDVTVSSMNYETMHQTIYFAAM